MLDDLYSKKTPDAVVRRFRSFLIGYFRWESAQDVNALSEG